MTKKKLRKRIRRLKDLVRHAWVHSGYVDCGFLQMTSEQKALYCDVVGADLEERIAAYNEAEERRREARSGGATPCP